MKAVLVIAALTLCAGAAFAQDKVQPPTVTITIGTGKTTAVVSWTAPGDACTNATVAEYDVRWSSSAITECNFTSATQFANIPSPSSPGSDECEDLGGATGSRATRSCGTPGSPEVLCP
ncbi:MAG: hypothetical protein HOP12_08770 [Candidatus Eisenbacteria bacterium]|uniref:Fibronectin type-III domain-containing protein n=1 Tax=Eiseniibacteriota bacterium TaxID=2212470 RepID=A0A849SQJ5_UNCEI|nr:hypothetical protein [Candidatus Eisenbacteria bacterium]